MEKRIFPITMLADSLKDVLENKQILLNTPCTKDLGKRLYNDFQLNSIQINIYDDIINSNTSNSIETTEFTTDSELSGVVTTVNSWLKSLVNSSNSIKTTTLKYNSFGNLAEDLKSIFYDNGSKSFSFEDCSIIDKNLGNNTLPPILLAEESPKVFLSKEDFLNNKYSDFRRYISDVLINYYESLINDILSLVKEIDIKFKDYLKLKEFENVSLDYLEDEVFKNTFIRYQNPSNNGIGFYLEEEPKVHTSPYVKTYKVVLCVPKVSYNEDYSSLNIEGYSFVMISNRLDTLPVDAVQTELDSEIKNIKRALEGDRGPNSSAILKCTPSNNTCEYDTKSDSLYVKRYMILNKRLNKLNGPLYTAKRYLDEINFINDTNLEDTSLIKAYSNDLETLKVLKNTPLKYFTSKEVPSTIPRGKFVTQEVFDILTNQIGEHCYLTCGPCSIRDTCPFYDQDAYLKTVCPPTNVIELWFKDNKIDLIDTTSIDFKTEDSEGLDINDMLKNLYKPYSAINLVAEDSYEATVVESQEPEEEEPFNKKKNVLQRKTSELEKLLKGQTTSPNLNFSSDRDSLDWLVGGYFGTVQKSNNSCFDPNSATNVTLPNGYQDIEFPDYTFLYDTLFLEDTETEFNYKETGNTPYDGITLELYNSLNNKVNYTGKAAIKEATSLKLLTLSDKVNPFDEVFLISEDDTSGIKIPFYKNGAKVEDVTPTPMICLGRICDISMDCNDFSHLAQKQEVLFDSNNPLNVSLQKSSSDKEDMGRNLVQWNINMLKGNSMYNPVNPMEHKGQDQFWMKTIYQKNTENLESGLFDVYSGRDRFASGDIGELTIDPQHPDLGRILLGKPFMINKENFGRKCTIKIADSAKDNSNDIQWSIPWISPRHLKQKFNLSINTAEDKIPEDVKEQIQFLQETRRVALTQMKTNLRLVVVHYSKPLDCYESYYKFD